MPTKVLVIKGGQTGIIRKNVKITSVGIVGNALPTSTCVNIQTALNNAVEYECFQIGWAVERDLGSGTGPWSQGDPNARIIEFGYADQSFALDVDLSGDNAGSFSEVTNTLVQSITLLAQDGLFVDMKLLHEDAAGERLRKILIFKTTPELAETTYLKFKIPDSDDVKMYAVTSTKCPPPEEPTHT